MPSRIKFYRDKNKARITRNKQRKLNYKRGRVYQINKGRWSKADVELISLDRCDRDIAALLGRSVEAVQIKRMRIKKINMSGGTAIT